MAENVNLQITITDNSPEVLRAVPVAIKRALFMVGAECEESAKTSSSMPVDTGLLRNSITFAVGGTAPNTTSYRADKPDKSGILRTGGYSGIADPGDYVVVGSNVEYAAAQELGTSRGIRPKHFLKNAVANGKEKIKAAIVKSFQNV